MKKILFVAAALAFATPASAVTVDPYDQLTGPTPAVGSFVFGTVNPGTGVITPFNSLQRPCDGNAPVTCFRNAGDPFGIPSAVASTVAFPSGTVNVPNDRIFLHPSNGAFAGVSFVAALSGTYNFAGEFSMQDVNPSGVEIGAIILNGAPVLTSSLLFAGSRTFNFDALLNAGQSVSFFVGPAGNSNNDSTGLFLRVTGLAPVVGAVPEPSTWLMMILGFGLVGGTLRSRRRAATGLAAA